MTNAKIDRSKPGQILFSFPREDGLVTASRSEFRDGDDLLKHLSQTLEMPLSDGGKTLQGKLRRHGKYQKVGANKKPVFASGHLLLDLITDDWGFCTVGSRRLHSWQALLEQDSLLGGVLTRKNTRVKEAVEREYLAALTGAGPFDVVHDSGGSIVLASKNPAKLTVHNDRNTVKLKAWRTDIWFYFSEGSELDVVRGPDFKKARIDSSYFKSISPRDGGPACALIKQDSDSDTNDDYMDEMEFTIFFETKPVKPSGHHSFCTASWGLTEDDLGGLVNKGACSSFDLIS